MDSDMGCHSSIKSSLVQLVEQNQNQQLQVFRPLQETVQADSQHFQLYNQNICSLTSLRLIKQTTLMNLTKNSYITLCSDFKDKIQSQTIDFDMQSALVRLSYGNFSVNILMIVTCFDEDLLKPCQFAKGGFGLMYEVYLNGNKYAVKGIDILIDQGIPKLDQVYRQYFVYYIAAQLNIGPSLQQIMGYDIVIFGNKACFSMQYCGSPFQEAHKFSISKVKQSLEDNLRIFHSIGLMHLDIKPKNILYSKRLKKFIFIDFGFSRFIKEELGKKTKIVFHGTIGYLKKYTNIRY